ncbi:MAG: zinc ABC transporter substrate-binding protein [Phycisphaerae bacterium]|nr:zinc ABC transporter substrate-binding protein [Phycisphaerae bacterium]
MRVLPCRRIGTLAAWIVSSCVWGVIVLVVSVDVGAGGGWVDVQPATRLTDRAEFSRSHSAGELRVLVTIPPLRSLAEPLARAVGGRVEILVKPGHSEHNFEIGPEELASLARADVIVQVGLGLDATVDTFVRDNPREARRVVIFAAAVGDEAVRTIQNPPCTAAEHDGHEHADHPAPDTHLWLDPILVRALVPEIRRAVDSVARARDISIDRLDDAEKRVLDEVNAVHDEYTASLAAIPAKDIITAHDAWRRPAGRYGLNVRAVLHLHPGEGSEVDPRSLAEAVTAIREHGVRAVFTEPQLDSVPSRRLAERAGLRLGVLDPLGEGDWAAMMRANLESLKKALGP